MNLLLDSGAFSARHARHARVTIDLGAYIKYCQDNEECIEKAVNLDVIPGTDGPDGKPVGVDEAAKQGLDNWRTMRGEGIHAMPVFHAREPWSYLHDYAREPDSDWIGLSSKKDALTVERRVWLRACFGLLAKHPHVRVHGFAETEISIALEFPWYSVDSGSALFNAAHSQVFVPTRNREGDWILGLYFVGPPTGKHAARQLSAQCPAVREAVRRRIEAHGFTVEQLGDAGPQGRVDRSIYNALEYERFVKERKPGLRDFQATRPENDPFQSRADIPNRLLSYATLRSGKLDLDAYVHGRPLLIGAAEDRRQGDPAVWVRP